MLGVHAENIYVITYTLMFKHTFLKIIKDYDFSDAEISQQ